MVSAPQFTPAIPELSRVLVQREDKWGVDPYLDFLGQWRVAHRAASGAHPTALNAGEISIVQGDTGGTIRLSYENAAGENVRSSLLAGTTPLVTTADHLMLGGDVTVAVVSVSASSSDYFLVTTGAFVQNDYDAKTGAAADITAINRGARLSVGFSNIAERKRLIMPLEPIEIMEEITSYQDENTRGRFAMDYNVYAGMRMVTGRISANAYLGSDADESAVASPTGHLLRAFWGNDRTVRLETDADWYVHNFFSTDVPGSMVVEVQDNVNQQIGAAPAAREPLTPVNVGAMVERLTINFDANDGLLTVGGDIRGRRTFYIDPPAGRGVDGLTFTGTSLAIGDVISFEGGLRVRVSELDSTDTDNPSAVVILNAGRYSGASNADINLKASGAVANSRILSVNGGIPTATQFPNGATVVASLDASTTPARRYTELDLSSLASVGWHGSVVITRGVDDPKRAQANPLPTVGRVLSAEITLEREINVHGTEGDNQIGTIRAVRPVRCTYRMTFEFATYEDFQKYSKDNPANDQFTDYTNNRDRIIFRFSNQPLITTDLEDEAESDKLGLVGGTGDQAVLTEDAHGVLDIVLHEVVIGESPASINRGEFSNTMEVNGRAFLKEDPVWFGDSPGAGTAVETSASPSTRILTADDAVAGSKVVQMRLINKRRRAY